MQLIYSYGNEYNLRIMLILKTGGIIMENLIAKLRVKNTIHSVKKGRRDGMVPGILYGKNIVNSLFEIGDMELEKKVSQTGDHGVLNLNLNGELHLTLIKEVQRDSINRKLIHIDLEEIAKDTFVDTEVPLIFNGTEKLGSQGGILQKEKTNVKIHCKGSEIPKSININVSNLKIGDLYRLGDIEVSKELTFLEDVKTVIAAVTKISNISNDVADTQEEQQQI